MSIVMSEPLVLRNRRWSVDDLEELPTDDDSRYEIIDGVLVVSGSPRMRHQRAAFRLARLLDDVCYPGLEVFIAPLAVLLRFDTVMQPDVLVARIEDLTEVELPAPPMLAVEVSSPGSGFVDLDLKFNRLQRAGCPSYWVIDPADDPAKARVQAWDLDRAGIYQPAGDVVGDAEFLAVKPFPVRVVPAELVR
jgi:Uma2 family endonuclease